jgi:hypothetical protein
MVVSPITNINISAERKESTDNGSDLVFFLSTSEIKKIEKGTKS